MAGTLRGVRYSGRANRKRYEPIGEWHTVETVRTAAHGWIRREFADLRDKQTGDTFHEGAFRVVADGSSALFFGETAWSDSARLYDDLLSAPPPTKGLGSLLP